MTALSMLIAFALDALLGDPRHLPHPVRLMGRGIQALERFLRAHFPATVRGEKAAGFCLAIALPTASYAVYALILFMCAEIHPTLRLLVESLMCYQLIAARALYDESMAVYRHLMDQDMPGARRALSMIVGRDTDRLDETGIAKAAVETVAENLSDGVIAPLCCMALGGAPLMALYKAINTLDSMVGYQNERYAQFGFASAKLDDIANFIPSRLSGLLIVASAGLLRLDFRGALRIFLRDRKNHLSPNSAQTESACAGALGVRLAGNASYGGVIHKKPTIGDALRPVCARDIRLANRLMYTSSLLGLMLLCATRGLIGGLFP